MGTQTTERLKSLRTRALEIAAALGIPEDAAWVRMSAADTQKVMETVERLEQSQKRRDQADVAADAAKLATLKAKLNIK
jgi:hypothetical protein